MRRDQGLQQFAAARRIEQAREQIDFVRFVRQHMDQRQPIDIPVFQCLQRLEKHDRLDGAIAVDQRESAGGLGCEQGPDEREHRRDPRAPGESDVMARAACIGRDAEAPVGGHDLNRLAGHERLVGPVREPTLSDPLDRHAQFAGGLVVGLSDAHRIRSAQGVVIDVRAKRKELPGPKAIGLAQVLGHLEGHRDRISGLWPDLADRQPVKAWHRHGGVSAGVQ